MSSLVDVTALCLVCTKPCREEQTGVPGEARLCRGDQSSGTEASQVTPASQLQDVLRTLLQIELENDGPTLVCGTCVSGIQAWQSLCEMARTSRAFFQQQRALRSLQPAAAACEMSHTEPGQGDRERPTSEPETKRSSSSLQPAAAATKRPLEPSSEPGTTRALLKTAKPPVQLNDYCLARVMYYLDTTERIQVQTVSQQWLRVGRQFHHLDTEDPFSAACDSVLSDLGVSLPKEDDLLHYEFFLPPPFHWVAFVRALALSGGSVRSLDLKELSHEKLSMLVPFINPTLCPGVKHVEMIVERPTGGDIMYDQAVGPICHHARLPKLTSLGLERAEHLTNKSLHSLTTHCLPYLKALNMAFSGFVPVATREDFKSFFRALPTTLKRFTLKEDSTRPSFLQIFVERLHAKPGLRELTSLELGKYGTEVGERESEMLASMCSALARQLTALKLAYGSSRGAGFLLPVRRLTWLRRFELNVREGVPLRDVASVLRDMRLLQNLHLRVGGGECEALTASLCQLEELSDLTIDWACVRNHLARLGESLPRLRRLTLEMYATVHFSREQVAGLVTLVGHCTRLEYLDISSMTELWGLDRTSELLRELASVLGTTRAAPPCPHTSQELPHGCDMCPGPTPLHVEVTSTLLDQHRGTLDPIVESTLLRLPHDD